MRASVVIPTYQRPRLLDRCLAAIAAQDFDPAAHEVIVVDDAASAATRRQVEGSAPWFRADLRYLPVNGRHGPAAARNIGWRAARGEIIAFTDDDCIPEPGWLRTGLATFGPGVAAVAGRTIVPLPEEPTDYERNAARLEVAEFITANCFCRREALERVGGFDERFAVAWREDSDLYFSLLERGDRIVRAPGAVVLHPVRPAPWGISLRLQRNTVFDALLYKKHPALYRRRIRPVPPWNYYASVASFVASLAAAAAGQPRVAWIAAGAWAALTGQFCWRRLRWTSRDPRHIAEMVATSALIPLLSIFWRIYGSWRFRVLFL
ncbi:MAG: glycosyltransferase [Isosphaeraceae bacterium]|nr:glycosyltransferase [Isosphaeraceae bacterium]